MLVQFAKQHNCFVPSVTALLAAGNSSLCSAKFRLSVLVESGILYKRAVTNSNEFCDASIEACFQITYW
jgi:hypothetical protein